MAVTETNPTTKITDDMSAIEALRLIIAGVVRFLNVKEALDLLKEQEMATFLFGSKPAHQAKAKQVRKDLYVPRKVQPTMGYLNRRWANATAEQAMKDAWVEHNERISLMQKLYAARGPEARLEVLTDILRAIDDKAAADARFQSKNQEKSLLISRVLDLVMDEGVTINNMVYFQLNRYKQRQVNMILDGEGMKISAKKLEELVEELEELTMGSLYNSGDTQDSNARREHKARVRANRAAEPHPVGMKGQEPPKHGKGKK